MEPEMDEQARMVNDLKEVANQSLSRGAFSKALRLYTRAIEADAGNAVLYSNRAAAHYQAGQFQESLEDAESAILCDESWWKGHKRKAQALVKLDRYEDAIVALEEGIAAAPDAPELPALLATTRVTLERLQTMYVLPGPEMMKKLDSVPVFLVTDQEGQPFFITYDDGTQACTIYFDPTDAQATLEWIQKENGPQGEKAILAPLSLTQAFALAQDTQQQYLDEEANAAAAALKKAEKAAPGKGATSKDKPASSKAGVKSDQAGAAADKPKDSAAADAKDEDKAEDKSDAQPDAKDGVKADAEPEKEPEKEQLTPLAFQFRPELRQVEAAVVLLKAMPPMGEDGQPLPKPATEEAEADKSETPGGKEADSGAADAPAEDASTPVADGDAPAAEPAVEGAAPEAASPTGESASHDVPAPAVDTEAAAAPEAVDNTTPVADTKDAPSDIKDAETGAKDAAAGAEDAAADVTDTTADSSEATADAKDAETDTKDTESDAKEGASDAKDDAAAAAAPKDGAAPGEEELTVDNFSGIPVFQAKGLTLLQNNQQNVPLFFSKWDLERSWSQLAASNPGEPLGELEIDVGTLEDVLRRMAESKTKEFDPVIFVPSREALKFVGREFPLEDLTGIKPPPPPKAMSEQGPPPKNLLQLAKMMAAAGASTDEIREAVRAKLVETREQQRLQEFMGPAIAPSKKSQKAGRAKKATSGGRKEPSGKDAATSSAPVSAC